MLANDPCRAITEVRVDMRVLRFTISSLCRECKGEVASLLGRGVVRGEEIRRKRQLRYLSDRDLEGLRYTKTKLSPIT